MEKEFSPEFTMTDIVNLGKYNVYLKLMIDGLAGRSFSAETLPPIPAFQESNREKIIQVSRERYSMPRQIIEEKIASWLEALPGGQAMPPVASQQVLYDARCSLCGKDTKVVFPPDGKRPVYCKSCRHKLERQREEARLKTATPEAPLPERKAQEISLNEATQKEPVFFSAANKEKYRKEHELKKENLEMLRQTIKESLNRQPEEKKDKEGKEIKISG